MAALFVFLVAILGDLVVSNKFIVLGGYADIKYEGVLVEEFNSKFGRFRFPRTFFSLVSAACALFYEFTQSYIFIWMTILFLLFWFGFSLRDAMRAKSFVDDIKNRRGW